MVVSNLKWTSTVLFGRVSHLGIAAMVAWRTSWLPKISAAQRVLVVYRGKLPIQCGASVE
jgi:uncharacterized membrane protein